MRCIKNVTEDLFWIGANDRRLALFEGVYSVPDGVSYNAYLLMDEKTVLFDTVDKAVQSRFLENLEAALDGRPLDYLIVQHMEPDHTAALRELIFRYPEMAVVCNAKTLALIKQFYDVDIEGRGARTIVVKENDTLATGRHTLHFIMAPMVHWPEVMVTYDATANILFSADAFGCFGALNGALFADEVDFAADYMNEARRYYCNIVGKYGTQVQALLEKAAAVKIDMICPLHGFVWRSKLNDIISKYALWSAYEPEERGVMLAYASVYGNTENAAEILACTLREKGVKTVMYDVSVTPASEVVAAAFKWSHLVFASTTYNAGVFVTMEAVISDLAAHNIQNRAVSIIENGSWAPTSGGLIRAKLEQCGNMTFIDDILTIKSGVKEAQLDGLKRMAGAIAETIITKPETGGAVPARGTADPAAMFKLSYGLFILTAKDGDKDNGCVVNTVSQVTASPLTISVTVNKTNYTHDIIMKTRAFNVSVLTESAPFDVFKRFGFASGRDTGKFAGDGDSARAANGIYYLTKNVNCVISGAVTETIDCGTHTIFIAEVTQAFIADNEPSLTYQYYFDHVKPKPEAAKAHKKGFVCKICGYVHEGDELPPDFICPLCKHGAADFERI